MQQSLLLYNDDGWGGGRGHVLLKCWFGTSLNYMALYISQDICIMITVQTGQLRNQRFIPSRSKTPLFSLYIFVTWHLIMHTTSLATVILSRNDPLLQSRSSKWEHHKLRLTLSNMPMLR